MNKNKGFVQVFLLALPFIVVLGLGGYYFYNNYQKVKYEPVEISPLPGEITTEASSSTTEEKSTDNTTSSSTEIKVATTNTTPPAQNTTKIKTYAEIDTEYTAMLKKELAPYESQLENSSLSEKEELEIVKLIQEKTLMVRSKKNIDLIKTNEYYFNQLTSAEKEEVTQGTKDLLEFTINAEKGLNEIFNELFIELGMQPQTTPPEIIENELKEKTIQAVLAGREASIKAGTSNIYTSSVIYFDENQNFGISNENNICTSSIIKNFSQHKETQNINCAVSKTYPSKSFTVTNKSTTEDGFYCVDQNGFAGLILNKNNQFVSGIKCK